MEAMTIRSNLKYHIMKKLFRHFLSAILFAVPCMYASAAWDGTSAAEYAGGNGTKDNPYLIATESQFAKFANDVSTIPGFSRGRYFKLTADLVMYEGVGSNMSSSMNGGKAYSPQTPMVGNFTDETTYTAAFEGIFDGDGHTISGLYSVNDAICVSLFRITYNATIKNLGVIDSYFYGNARFAGIVGKMVDSKLINCYVKNTRLEGYGSYAGCIVGQCVGSSQIINCYSDATLTAKNNAGGIVGRIGEGKVDSCIIDNCVSISTLTTTKSNKAGISSENSSGSIVRNCFYANTLPSAISSDKGKSENISSLAPEAFAGDSIVAVLNTNAENIPGACRWIRSSMCPALDYRIFTIDGDEVDISAMATSPIPADGNLHADGDSGAVLLQWNAAIDGKTTKQYLYIGTNKNSLSAVTPDDAITLGTDTCYNAPLQSKTAIHYWRVDRVDADGVVTKGSVWSFQPRLLAFPGAEGYGRFAHGGRGGKVVYVTNLNASGEGSFHHAVTEGSGPRTVIFNVSGLIVLDDDVKCDDYVTIAGQTAPGKGICIANGSVGIANDNICRFLRSRRGGDADTGGSIGFYYADNAIIDHATASWGTDETFSSRSCQNISIQRSIISEALGIAGHRKYPEGTNHDYAATIGGDIGSFHHNLLANCYGRNWSMGGGTDANGYYAGRLDIFNNVVYNWGTRTTDGGAHEVNFVNNYYKMGVDTRLTTLFTINIEGNLKGTQSAYVSGNIRDNKDGSLSTDKLNDTYRLSIDDGRGSIDWDAFVDAPYFPSYAKIESAQEAYKSVLSDVGANLPLSDDTDRRVIKETLERSYTYVGSKSGIRGEIDNEKDAGGYELYPEEMRPADFDTDLDGLPDWWEEINGSNVNSATGDYSDSHADNNNDGFSALEDYLAFMASPNKILKPGEVTDIDLKAMFAGYTQSPMYTVDDPQSISHISGSKLTIAAPSQIGIYPITLTVTDGDGASYTRLLNIAVTQKEILNIEQTVINENDIRSYEIYSLGGVKIESGNCAENTSVYTLGLPNTGIGIYLLKVTDGMGMTKSYKIVKDK